MARLFLVLSLVLAGPVHLTFGEQPSLTLLQDLRRILDRQLAAVVDSLDGVIGYSSLDLTSGEEIGRLERQAFPTASTIKLAILYELFRQADERKVSLDTPAPLDRAHVVGGSGILRALGTPSLTLRDHAVLMMSISDNTATNVLIDRLGLAAIAARMESLGLGGILPRRKMRMPPPRHGATRTSPPRARSFTCWPPCSKGAASPMKAAGARSGFSRSAPAARYAAASRAAWKSSTSPASSRASASTRPSSAPRIVRTRLR